MVPDSERSGNAREPMLAAASREASRDVEEATAPVAASAGQAKPLGVFQLYRDTTAQERMMLLIASLASCVQGATFPAMSFLMKNLFEGIFLPNDNMTLPPATGPHTIRDQHVLKSLYTFLGLAAVTFTVTSVSVLTFALVADNVTQRVRRKFFQHLLKKDVGWYDKHSAAEMATRLTNDTYDFQQGIGAKTGSLIAMGVMSPAGFAVAFYQDWRLTLIMLGAIPFMAIGFGLSIKQMTKSAAQQQEQYAKAGGIAESAISAVRTVAAFSAYEKEVTRYDAQLAHAEAAGIRAGWCGGFSMGLSSMVMYMSCALGFYAGSLLVIHDFNNDCWKSNPPYGTCFTGATMLSTLFSVIYGAAGLGQMMPFMATFTAGKAAGARIYQIIDEPPAFDAEAGLVPGPRASGAVTFEDVRFFYPTRQEIAALDKVSFTIRAGSSAAFVGPSGSGKSTAIVLLQRFYDPTSGVVKLDGTDIRSLSLRWLRSQMALVQQEPVLFLGTVRENIAYGKQDQLADSQDGSEFSGQVEDAAKAANAHNFIMDFPQGYNTEVGERGTQLSGGQKQRIAIARAMIRDPAVLLLDEATSALDTESERVVQQALDQLMAAKARTTLVVAHRLSTVRDCERIFVLENGHLIESGTHSELMAKPGSLYAQLAQLQEITEESDEMPPGRPVAPLRQKSTQSEKLTRQVSQASATAVHAEEGEAQAALAPPEDDEDVTSPGKRLWALQSANVPVIVVALLCTVVVGATRPLIGLLFSKFSNKFSQPAVQCKQIPASEDLAPSNGTARALQDRPPCIIDGVVVGVWEADPNYADDLMDDSHGLVLMFVVLALVTFLSSAGQMGGFRRSAEALTRKIRRMTFEAMLRQEISWFDARSTGHLADRLASEAPLVKSYTGESLAAVLQLLCTVGTGLGIALQACWQLTLACFAFLPLMSVATAFLVKSMQKTNTTKAGPLVSEAMSNIRTVAAFGLEEKVLTKYSELQAGESAVERRTAIITSFVAAYNQGLNMVMFGGIIFVANVFIDNGWAVPDNVLQVLFPIMFAASGAAIASQWQTDKVQARKAVNHIFHTLDRVPSIDAYNQGGDKPDKVSGAVEFCHVSFSYPSRPDVPIFTDFDLKIEPSTTVAFCGPSGSGKSTTVALLQRWYDPVAGSVCLDGHDIRNLNLAWLRSHMALVQQEPVLFSGTILQNISYGKEGGASQQECIDAAMAANAHNFITAFPNGYNTEAGERGAQLSGGQKQRIAIARAMVRNPALLLLDEATSALDAESERVVQEALDQLMANKSRTTLVIAHRLATIVNSDVICVIYKGRIVEKGSHAELMRISDGHYRKLAERQNTSL